MYSTQTLCVKRLSIWTGALLIALLLLVQACSPLTSDGSDEITETPANQQPEPLEPPAIEQPEPADTPAVQEPESSESPTEGPTSVVRELRPIIRTPEWVPFPPSEPGPAVSGETPDSLLDDILSDLSKRTGVDRQEIEILRNKPVIWSDGSLGCPEPGVFYTQALVPGYWVVLQIREKEFDYRASERGFFVFCESGFLPFDQPPDR
jgi:hypothetical protein